jgi:hypothetical protein
MSGDSRRRCAPEIDFRSALSHSRRVTAHSHDIRRAAKNAGCTSSNENARTELACGNVAPADFHASPNCRLRRQLTPDMLCRPLTARSLFAGTVDHEQRDMKHKNAAVALRMESVQLRLGASSLTKR